MKPHNKAQFAIQAGLLFGIGGVFIILGVEQFVARRVFQVDAFLLAGLAFYFTRLADREAKS